MIIDIDDPDDPRCADYRNLPDPELLERRGVFIAEGRLVVRRLLQGQEWATRSVMVTSTALAALRDLVDERPELPVYVVTRPVMDGIAGFNIHRGCLAIGERPPARNWRELAAGASRLVVLERTGNADNVGSVFRSAAAFGVDAVLLDAACTDPLYRKAIRTSMGSALTVPFARADPWPGALRELSHGGWTTIGLTPSPDARLLHEALAGPAGHRVALVLGHEGDGLTADTLGLCSRQARIAISPAVDSLNVATAAAIALYELSRVRAVPSAAGRTKS